MTVLYHKRERCSWLHACRPYLDEQGSRGDPSHGHFFCDSKLESHKFRGQSPFQIFSAVTLLADRLGQYAIGDKPLRNRGCFRHLSYFTSARSAHVVTMAVIAGTGFEPVAFGLWARRATAALPCYNTANASDTCPTSHSLDPHMSLLWR